ncbi:hypothetical protein ACTMS0_23925 [Micromonospora sp. H33]|uniref:hypothetical protein n=1 Tax=Micromonospora sp. H33 TaxID=3452215 RepID=UPI003F8BD4E9
MLRRRTPLVLLSLLVTLGLVACGTPEPAALRLDAPSMKAAVKAAPGPRPAPKSAAEVRQRVRLGMMDLSGFRPETAEHTEENTDAWYLRSLCRDELPSDRHAVGQRDRRWVKSPVWIRHYVVGFQKVPGRKLIDELRSVLKTCRTYRTHDGRTSTIVAWRPPGVAAHRDVVTFCERQKTDTGIVNQCTIMMARGHYVMEVDASDGDGDLKKSQALTAKLYPLTAMALLMVS